MAGQVCLITGAGSGLGRLFALEFARRRALLVLWDINTQSNEETAGMVRHIYRELAEAASAPKGKRGGPPRCPPQLTCAPSLPLPSPFPQPPCPRVSPGHGAAPGGHGASFRPGSDSKTLSSSFFPVAPLCPSLLSPMEAGSRLPLSSQFASWNPSKAPVVLLSVFLSRWRKRCAAPLRLAGLHVHLRCGQERKCLLDSREGPQRGWRGVRPG